MNFDEEKIIQLFSDGYSLSKIKYIMGCRFDKVSKLLKNNGFDTKKYSSLNLDEDKICEMYLSGKFNIIELQKKFNIKSDSAIRRILNKHNISINFRGKNRIPSFKILNTNIQDICYLYYDCNLSAIDVGKSLNISAWTVLNRLKENGFKPLSQGRNSLGNSNGGRRTRYLINDNFLDVLDKNSAWFIGWVLSDGSINNSHINIGLSEKDNDVLEKIKILLQYKGNIYKCSTVLNNKRFFQSRLYMNSSKLVSKLTEYSILPNKTLNEVFPNIIKFSDEKIIKSFIQGVFEGDGSFINNDKTNYHVFQIVGTYELLSEIQNKLIEFLNLKQTKLTNNIKNKNHYALRYSGKYQSMKIMDWLYSKKPNYYMDRKYKLYLEEKKKRE